MITLVNEYSAVIDACVLLPIQLCDILLRLAEEPALYSPKWSHHILGEVERNLQGGKFRIEEAKTKYRILCMTSSFPEAMVTGYEDLINCMSNPEKDRHILACAIVARADCIVTNNMKHFLPKDLERFGIEAITPDDFLINQWTLSAQVVKFKLLEQSRKYQRDFVTHLDILGRSVPNFAQLLRTANP